MRVLVTGSAGFVGRHFVKRLVLDGHTVDQCDLVDGLDCLSIFATAEGWDLVVHCAANVGGRANIDGNPLTVAHNLALDEAMFRWAYRTGTRVLYFSSSAAYPTWLQAREIGAVPLAEDMLFNGGMPDATYGWSKLSGEVLAQYARAQGVDVHVVRPFSGYGEDQALDYPFPSFVDRAKRRADPFEIWGDGTQVRDFIHIDDIVEACLAIIAADCQEPVNLATGIATSFLDLAAQVTAAVGYEPRIELLADKPTGVHTRVGDPTLMHEFWTPRVTLAEGIMRAVSS